MSQITMEPSVKTPFEKGKEAYFKGKRFEDNPFPKGTKNHWRWFNGWMRGWDEAKSC